MTGFFALCSCKQSDVLTPQQSHNIDDLRKQRPKYPPRKKPPSVTRKARGVRESCSPRSAKASKKKPVSKIFTKPVLWSGDEYFKRLKFVVLQQQQQQPLNTGLFDLALSADQQSLRVTDVKDDDPMVSCIAENDVLEYIGDEKLSDTPPSPGEALKRIADRSLEQTSWPCVLRFVSAKPTSWQRFNVVCYGDEIGMDLVGHGPEDLPVVTEVHDPTSRLRPGDVLVALNGIDAVHLGCRRALHVIEELQRRVLLTFHRIVTPGTVSSSRSAYKYSMEREKTSSDKEEEILETSPCVDLSGGQWI